ncbi:uncharacterized protein LOC123523994 [Mercenaria mercenaria]|uniref:uncharacterized protein LOC123523994 n=1 Tax=Mercenaria mercenaria TaxID=6596 RepID=UPI00234E56C4|nr:uncharacterized protein LOC123523994 [Mercenaria mercenaria]
MMVMADIMEGEATIGEDMIVMTDIMEGEAILGEDIMVMEMGMDYMAGGIEATLEAGMTLLTDTMVTVIMEEFMACQDEVISVEAFMVHIGASIEVVVSLRTAVSIEEVFMAQDSEVLISTCTDGSCIRAFFADNILTDVALIIYGNRSTFPKRRTNSFFSLVFDKEQNRYNSLILNLVFQQRPYKTARQ